MAIYIAPTKGNTLLQHTCDMIFQQPVEVYADSEAEILAFEEILDDGNTKVIPTPGSFAMTVENEKAITYIRLPKGWVKAS